MELDRRNAVPSFGIRMGKKTPPASEIEIKVHRMLGNKLVCPLEIDPAAAPVGLPNRDEVRPFEQQWTPLLIPIFVAANVIVFVITMYVNDCPRKYDSCFAPFLGRFAFQPRSQNMMLGPSPST